MFTLRLISPANVVPFRTTEREKNSVCSLGLFRLQTTPSHLQTGHQTSPLCLCDSKFQHIFHPQKVIVTQVLHCSQKKKKDIVHHWIHHDKNAFWKQKQLLNSSLFQCKSDPNPLFLTPGTLNFRIGAMLAYELAAGFSCSPLRTAPSMGKDSGLMG